MQMKIMFLHTVASMAMATDGFQLPRRVSMRARFEPVRNIMLSAATVGNQPNPPPRGELQTFGSRRLAKIVPPKEMKKVLPLVSLTGKVEILQLYSILKRNLVESPSNWNESI